MFTMQIIIMLIVCCCCSSLLGGVLGSIDDALEKKAKEQKAKEQKENENKDDFTNTSNAQINRNDNIKWHN